MQREIDPKLILAAAVAVAVVLIAFVGRSLATPKPILVDPASVSEPKD